ncbi:hypothetical protein DP64_10345 [Stutzerimonas degradans]|nr:hypothetical protein DP64_10345 [Stutzerimonas degradans]
MDFAALLAFVAAAGLCVAGGWVWVSRWSRIRHLQDTPTSRIRSAAKGYVELVGVLRESGAAPLTAPLSGQPCLWWRYRIEEYGGTGERRSWRVIERGTSEAWLRLADASGECLIDPRGAEVLPAWRRVWTGDQRHPRGLPTHGWLDWLNGGRQYRYVEERLHAGEPLYAIGEFRTFGGGRQGLDQQRAQAEVIRQWKGDFAGLLRRFDRDGDGRLDEQEWHRVRLAAGLEAEDRHRTASSAPAIAHLTRPQQAQPFVLSSHGEEVLARRFYWQAAAAALACLGGALWLALQLGVSSW